jgi:hypothetical protein
MPPVSVSGRFSVFALNSVWLRDNAVIYSGDVAARDASPGPWLDSNAEISVGIDVTAADGVGIFGDSVNIKSGASVDDIYYNELVNNGVVRGQQVTPLALPVWDPPEFQVGSPGTLDITVDLGQSQDLGPGSYRHVIVRSGGTLNLTGGTYHFNDIELKYLASMIALGPVELRIKDRLELDNAATVKPSAASGAAAKDIVIYIEGVGSPDEEALEVDRNSTVKANIYAPNGSMRVEEDCELEGGFIAKDVEIGIRTTVRLDSAFGHTITGDIDGDGDLDGKDLALFLAAYAIGNSTADLNNDGAVNAADVGVFAGNFGESEMQSGVQALPSSTVSQSIQGQSVQSAAEDPGVIRNKIKVKDKKSKTRRRN